MPATDAVIALGGNALQSPGGTGDLTDQYTTAQQTTNEIVACMRYGLLGRLVLTHGNGPQVGNILRRVELARGELHELTLDVCVADSQGGMGYMLEQCLRNSLLHAGTFRPCATLLTQTLVNAADPAFQNPVKGIGGIMTREEAERRARELGWSVREEPSKGGWRRVVASPEPLDILELDATRLLANSGVVVITVGGGGVPVIRDEDGRLRGVGAVIDKDLASAFLAIRMRLPELVILTGADGVYLNYGRDDAEKIDSIGVGALREMAAEGHFPPGNMGPKVAAAIRFIEAGGVAARIAAVGDLEAALRGEAGTVVLPDAAP